MSKTVYVVMGSCGEYSDHREWCVGYVVSEDQAKKWVTRLTEEGHKNVLENTDEDGWFSMWDIEDEVKAQWLDPNFTKDYSGFNYYYMTVPELAKND